MKRIGLFIDKVAKNKKIAFSIAESLITLAIVGIAMGSAAPLISKSMKNSQMSNLEVQFLKNRIERLEAEINQAGVIKLFYDRGCPTGWSDIGYSGHYIRITGSNEGKVGTQIGPSLPNIVGGFPGVGAEGNKPSNFFEMDTDKDGLYGAFYVQATGNPLESVAVENAYGDRDDYFGFNAHLANAIYGAVADDMTTANINEADEVLPRAVHIVACKKNP